VGSAASRNQGVLEETYGIMVYQEQVMEIAQTMGGYTLGGADLLRRAMGKKIRSEMDSQTADFYQRRDGARHFRG
jgi:DNA polymerase-3 subunit alpha